MNEFDATIDPRSIEDLDELITYRQDIRTAIITIEDQLISAKDRLRDGVPVDTVWMRKATTAMRHLKAKAQIAQDWHGILRRRDNKAKSESLNGCFVNEVKESLPRKEFVMLWEAARKRFENQNEQ